MARVNQARQDAEWVLANVLEPTTPLERMALRGAKIALRQLEQLANYRAKNIERIRAQNRAYLAKKHGTGTLYPAALQDEAKTWQWSLWALNEVDRGVNIWSLHAVRLPPEDRDPQARDAAADGEGLRGGACASEAAGRVPRGCARKARGLPLPLALQVRVERLRCVADRLAALRVHA